MHYQFIDAGSIINNLKQNTLYLDVGNNLIDGIIDHHQLNMQKSATHLVFEYKNLINENVDTIVVHKSPDLDCIASSYLASYYLKYGNFPSFYKQLIEFLDKSDFGNPLNNITNLATCFIILKSKSNNDLETLKDGHKLIEDMSQYGFDTEELPSKYITYKNEINDDFVIYQKETNQYKKTYYKLPIKLNSNLFVKIKCIIMIKPSSRLFKDWARIEGYDLLIVKWSNKRTVISVKNDSTVNLFGLGEVLNNLEQKKRNELNIMIKEENRIGYNLPDPWYDGRAHNYTIVDSPKVGTYLALNDILKCIELFCK